MSSVTGRINAIKQPIGGYIKPSKFNKIVCNDKFLLNETENVHGTIIGMVVDYLTRFMCGTDKKEAFQISLQGAQNAENFGIAGSIKTATYFLNSIVGIDPISVVNACKLVTFDVWYRNPVWATSTKNHRDINPDGATVQNIQTLVRRSMLFFEQYGPIIKDGFSFEPVKPNINAYEKMLRSGKGSYGGYTATVTSGDGDFLTLDTLWDFKISKSKPTSKHTLQLLMYWIMGQHSEQEIYKNITKLGIFNPRSNAIYLLDIKSVPDEVIRIVEKEVICYE